MPEALRKDSRAPSAPASGAGDVESSRDTSRLPTATGAGHA